MPVRMPITTQRIARAEKERREREEPEADRSTVARLVASPETSPSAPPNRPRRTPSAWNCRMMSSARAPTARRRPISLRRARTEAESRLEMPKTAPPAGSKPTSHVGRASAIASRPQADGQPGAPAAPPADGQGGALAGAVEIPEHPPRTDTRSEHLRKRAGNRVERSGEGIAARGHRLALEPEN